MEETAGGGSAAEPRALAHVDESSTMTGVSPQEQMLVISATTPMDSLPGSAAIVGA